MHAAKLIVVGMIGCLSIGRAQATDDITIGKAVPNSFAFATVEVGLAAKTWESEGLNVTVLAFRGDAVLQQALTSGSIDFGLGSGPALGFRIKGAGATAVAVVAGAPYNMSLCVPVNSTIHDPSELKGRTVGFSTVGSLTDWLVRELSRQQGWGSNGIRGVPLGTAQSSIAAIRSGQADGVVGELATCLQLEHDGTFKVLVNFGDRVKQFYTHVMFARNDLIEKRPDLVHRLLVGWFKTIAYMLANKAPTLTVVEQVMGLSPEVASDTYDREMAMMSRDGAFDAPTLEVIAASLKELNILPDVPPIAGLYAPQFTPIKLP